MTSLMSSMPGMQLEATEQADGLPPKEVLISRIEDRLRENTDVRQMVFDRTDAATLRDMWEKSYDLFMGDQDSTTEHYEKIQRITLNKIEPGVIGSQAVETEQPIKIAIEPRETGDEPTYFLRPTGSEKAMAALLREDTDIPLDDIYSMFAVPPINAEQFAGEKPISRRQYQLLLSIPNLRAGEMLLEEDDFFALNDATAAEAAQIVFDRDWKNAKANAVFEMVRYNTSIYGTDAIGYQWNAAHQRSQFYHCDLTQTFWDPREWLPDEMNYWIVDTLEPIEAVLEIYADVFKDSPAKRKEMLEAATTNSDLESEYEGVENRTDFLMRKMVRVRRYYERHATFPAGAGRDRYDTLNSTTGEADPFAGEAVEDGLVEVMESEDEERRLLGYRLPNGNQVAPGDPEWPKVSGVMQFVYIVDTDIVLFQGRCPYCDIPLELNRNVFFPAGPLMSYGISDPWRARYEQMHLNEMATAEFNHFKLNTYPTVILPTSLKELNPGPLYQHPMLEVELPDATFEMLVAKGLLDRMWQRPPDLDLSDRLSRWEQRIEDRLGNVDVLQGQEPSTGSSGRKIDSLTKEAKGPIAYRAKEAERMIQRMAEIQLDALIKWLPEPHWIRILSKYPKGVATAFIRRIKSMSFDMNVSLITGSGQQIANKREEARYLHQAGVLSEEALHEIIGVLNDPKSDRKKRMREQQEDAAAQAGLANAAMVGQAGGSPSPQNG